VTRLGEISPKGRIFFFKKSPKINIKTWALNFSSFCLKLPNFRLTISSDKGFYLVMLHFGRYLY
jgi:hypothetical protein